MEAQSEPIAKKMPIALTVKTSVATKLAFFVLTLATLIACVCIWASFKSYESDNIGWSPVLIAHKKVLVNCVESPQKKDAEKNTGIRDVINGDINGDGIDDRIVVLNVSIPFDTWTRPVLLFTGNEDETYTLKAASMNLVGCSDCGGVSKGDPYDGIDIKDDTFTIYESGGSPGAYWDGHTTFSYNKDKQYWFATEQESGSDTFGKKERSTKTAADLGQVPFGDYGSRNMCQ